MKQPKAPTLLRRLSGVMALCLILLFIGNIILAKVSVTNGFQAPRLSVISEFLTLLVATLLAVIFCVGEETLKKKGSKNRKPILDFQPEEERL